MRHRSCSWREQTPRGTPTSELSAPCLTPLGCGCRVNIGTAGEKVKKFGFTNSQRRLQPGPGKKTGPLGESAQARKGPKYYCAGSSPGAKRRPPQNFG